MINPLLNIYNNNKNNSDDYIEVKKTSPSSSSINTFDIESIEPTKKSATIISCFFNLANTILGAGMLGLPYAFSKSGWLLGSFLMIFSGISSCFALHFLTLCSLKGGVDGLPASFYSVASEAMPSFKSVIDLAVALKCFGVATSYLIVIGDTIPDVMIFANASESWHHRQIWITLGFFIVIPLCYLRNVDALKYTSFASICFVFFIMILIILFSLGIINEPDLEPCIDITSNCIGDKSFFSLTLDTGRVFSIFIFGFTCQQNIFAVINELEDVSINRVDKVISLSIGMAFCIYMLISFAGYSTYGSNVQSDILLNYPDNILTTIARVCVALLVCFSYPLQSHPARRSILSLVSLLMGDDQRIKSDGPISENILNFRYIVVTGIFLIGSFLIASTVKNLGTILGFVGATGSTMVSYILPGFSYYIIFKDEGPVWKKNLAFYQGCIGLIIVPLCLTFIFI